jgi:hypothetical protein
VHKGALIVKTPSQFLMVICMVGDERVAMWQVMNCDDHDHADSCEHDSIWGRATLQKRVQAVVKVD